MNGYRGIEYYRRYAKETNVQAWQLFEKAITLDPQYAAAYVALSSTYWVESLARWSTDPQTLEHALAMAQKAVALDDSLPGGHSLLSLVYALKQQYEQAIAEGDRAIALDPNNADSYECQAQTLECAGRPEEALQAIEKAMRLNPRHPPAYLFHLGLTYRFTGRYAEAIATQKEAINQSPNFIPAHFISATCGSGSLNRAPRPRRWSRQWRRRNGPWPSMTPRTGAI